MSLAKPKSNLLELARAKWRSSGLTDAMAAKLQMEPIAAEQVVLLSKNFQRVGALLIPYFNIQGVRTSFYRIRYLEPLTGFAGAAKKPQKYAQAPGTLNEVYFPPLMEFSWWDVACDPKVPIYITEGELKAAAGCSLGLPTLGLGGVDVWRSTKRGIEMFQELEQIKWTGRTVVVVYDSDAAVNTNVVRAQNQLAKALVARGAIPHIASLPSLPDGQKQGLDDFLVRHGAEELIKRLEDATAFPEAAALWEMNEDVVYVRDPGFVVVRGTGQRIPPGSFTQHAFSNRHYMESQQGKKSVVMVKKPLAPRWLQWEHRFELDKITYRPGQPRMTDANEWNAWPGWGVEPKPGDVTPWKWLLGFLFHNADPGAQKWFEQWCAYPLQYPGAKLFTSVAVWGRYQGTGKTLVAYTLRRIYGQNFREIKNRELRGGFNEWAENKQFVYGDEITGGDKRIDADWLKGIITQEVLTINAKYVPSFTLPDCINYYFTSNHPDAFFLEDTDRRFFIHEVSSPPAEKNFYDVYDKWLHGEGPAHLFDYLLKLGLKGFDPTGHAPQTTSKARMLYDSKSDLGIWCVALREDTTATLSILGKDVSEKCDLFTPTQLHGCYDPERQSKVTTNGLSRELKRAGFQQANGGIPVLTSVGIQRLYAVRNTEKWLSQPPAELRKHFDSFFGVKAQRKFQ